MGRSEAVAALDRGDPVLLYDGGDREGEVDMVYAAGAVDRHGVARLRTRAGGLVCAAVDRETAENWGVPFRDTLYADFPFGGAEAEPYGDRTSFSVTVNHRDTRTGITDRDRAKTITALAEHAGADADAFADTFRVPGHVHLLVSRGLAERRGHTELAVDLVRDTDHAPVAVVCEMLDAGTGDALARADARGLAEANGWVFLEAEDVSGAE